MLLSMQTSIFFTKEIWLFIFGGLILLYVIAAIYNRIKRPKKGIKTIKAKVEAVTKVRVQTTHRNVGLDGLMSSSAAIPGAKFEVTVSNEENNDVLVFSVSEKECDKLKVGDRGILKYNGDEFISFGEEDGNEKTGKIYFVRKHLVSLILIGAILIGAGSWAIKYLYSSNSEDVKEIEIESIDERPLTVYMSAHITNYKNPGEEMLTTRYSLGDHGNLIERWGESSHIYYDAIENYKRDTKQELEIKYFSSTDEMIQTAHEEWKKGTGPDVIIGDYTMSGYSLYPYVEEGMFADLLPYFEEDEVYSGGEYVSEVLEGGRMGDSQLIFPLTFTMNVLLTSEERMQEHELWLSEGMSYGEILDLFQNEWNAVRDEDEYLMVQYTNTYRNSFPFFLFQSASGVSLVNYETGKIQLSEEVFTDWARLYESYVCNEYNMDRAELKEFAIQNPDISLPREESAFEIFLKLSNLESPYDVFDITKENVFCYAEGGSSAGYFHPFVANTRYYESRLTDDEETFVCVAIPSINAADKYEAEITSFGVVLSESKKIQEGYEFIKALADNEHWMHFDLSVNRQMITETLEDLSASVYKLNTNLASAEPGEMPETEIVNTEAEDYEDVKWYGSEAYMLKPLSEETKEYLLELVDRIGVANLPEYQLDLIVLEEIGEYIWGDTDTIDEAYNNTIDRLVQMGYLK